MRDIAMDELREVEVVRERDAIRVTSRFLVCASGWMSVIH